MARLQYNSDPIRRRFIVFSECSLHNSHAITESFLQCFFALRNYFLQCYYPFQNYFVLDCCSLLFTAVEQRENWLTRTKLRVLSYLSPLGVCYAQDQENVIVLTEPCNTFTFTIFWWSLCKVFLLLRKYNKWELILAAPLTKQYIRSFLMLQFKQNVVSTVCYSCRGHFSSRQALTDKVVAKSLKFKCNFFKSWIMHENYTPCFQILLNLFRIANIFAIVLRLCKLTHIST